MEALKVTDPKRIVTDPVLLAHLERHGVDKDFVEFTSDYGTRVKGKSSPCAKFYRDLKSGRRFMVVTQLPMVDHEGKAIEPGWQEKGNNFSSRNNLFTADVEGLQVTITACNDQPDGRKTGQRVIFRPQVFLGGIELTPVSEKASLLAIDPLNSNYAGNTLEWDYGICKRRLRIIEGRLLGSWVFEKTPKGEVRIKYNQTGSFKLNLGKFKINDDEELIPTAAFENPAFGYPFTVSDSSTFYPDAHTESTSVDGYAYQDGTPSGGTWANLRDGVGSGAFDDTTYLGVNISAGSTSNLWQYIIRSIILFDTSALPNTAVISAATLSIYGYGTGASGGWGVAMNVYSSEPASNTAIVAGDYDSLGITAFSTAITQANFHVGAPGTANDFALNTAGIAAISLVGVSKFGLREANYDVVNSAPVWAGSKADYMNPYSSEQGTGYKPKLVVTYTAGEVKTSGDSGSGAEAVSLRETGTAETGSGAEASLAAMVLQAGDGGSGSETGGLLKSLFGSDEGSGSDKYRMLGVKAGVDMKLSGHRGEVGMPGKEVSL